MIGYCPLDEISAEPVVAHREAPTTTPVPPTETKQSILGAEDTECNYVIMAFIVGVMLLAAGDLRK